jgi:CheY-like chemotaxis protein
MPKMDGFGFLEHLRKIGLSMKTKIIMLSSSCSKEDRDKALSYKNVLAFVQKPLTEDIIRKIQAAYC